MTKTEAVGWVKTNKHKILGKCSRYLRYVPYDAEDYVSIGFEAALVAVNWCEVNRVDDQRKFESVFWSVWKDRVSRITPNPSEPSDYDSEALADDCSETAHQKAQKRRRLNNTLNICSTSIPCKCVDEDFAANAPGLLTDDFYLSSNVCHDVETRLVDKIDNCRPESLEEVFVRIAAHMKSNEKKVAEQLLGLAPGGRSTYAEAALRTGLHENSILYISKKLPGKILKIKEKLAAC